MPKSIIVKVNTVDSDLEFSILPSTLGRQLFDQINKTINVREVWWFGLQYEDNKGYPTWLKLKNKICTQDSLGSKACLQFQYRARYFPEDAASELIQEVTQRMFFLQIKDAILNDRIYCPADASVLLASYAAQAKYDDYEYGMEKYLLESTQLCKRITDQHSFTKEEWVDKIVAWWRDHTGLLKEDAMMEYLKIAQDLEMYGVNYFEIKNKKGTSLYLGVDALGLNVYELGDKLTPKIGFPWSEIRNVSFRDKKFTIQSVDKKAPDFIFFAPRVRVNKRILALCMGNHELYSRRRKGDQVEVQQLKAVADLEKKIKISERERLNQERRSRELAELRLRELEQKLYEQNTDYERTQKSLSEYEQRVRQLENALAEEALCRNELEEVRCRLQASNLALEQAKNARSEEYEQLLQENHRIMDEVTLKNQLVEKTAHQLEIYTEQLKIEQEKLANQSRYGETVASQPNSEPQFILSADVDGVCGDLPDSYAHDLSLQSEALSGENFNRNEENRQPAIDRDISLRQRLKNLSDDLKIKRDSSKMDRSDVLHEENRRHGRDKFKTLKQIRQGNTKKRIDEFESM